MKNYLAEQLKSALAQIEGVPADFEAQFEPCAKPEFGDIATNVAMQLARALKQNPRAIAQQLLEVLQLDKTKIQSAEIAGAGFINFRFANDYLYDALQEIIEKGANYGKTNVGEGKKAIVEYVSANPTGPLTVGHGRNAVLGDTLANLMQWVGYDVTKEYYFNDAGMQMRRLALSVKARYVEILDPNCPKRMEGNGEDAVEVPEIFPKDGYLGHYIIDIAQSMVDAHGDTLVDSDDLHIFQKTAQDAIFEDIEKTMLRLGVKMDSYFNENDLYTSNAIWEVLERLKSLGYIYEKDKAIWFKTTEFGKDVDTVLVKSSGEPTYRLPDIAYHINKLERGFDVLVDVFGADHIGTIPDVLNGVKALGFDADRVQVLIYQFVTLMRGGEAVKMSTRKANFVTLDELMDEVSPDVARFFFLMNSPNTQMNFDLDLAKEASEKNPCFYLQYAHARICQIEGKVTEMDKSVDVHPNLSLLNNEQELSLIKTLLDFPKEVTSAAAAKSPNRLVSYLQEVAKAFSQFYGHSPILKESTDIASARLALALATKTVLANGLGILGISSPTKM